MAARSSSATCVLESRRLAYFLMTTGFADFGHGDRVGSPQPPGHVQVNAK